MKMIGTQATQQARRRHLTLPNGTGYYKGEYLQESACAAADAPHVFLIEQDPNTTILPHFHQQNKLTWCKRLPKI